MRVYINNKEVVIPSSLSEITLGQRIEFHQQYGKELDETLHAILKMEPGVHREIEEMEFSIDKMYKTFAFFAGCTLEAVKEEKFVEDITNIYYSCLAVLFDDEKKLEYQPSFFWNDEEWEIGAPELTNGDKRTFGQFIDAKQIVKDMADLGASKWETMLPLCAIYLRKKGEKYKEEFAWEGSDRRELMKSLPMDKAMQVGFFLSSTMNFSINILMSLKNPEQKEAASI